MALAFEMVHTASLTNDDLPAWMMIPFAAEGDNHVVFGEGSPYWRTTHFSRGLFAYPAEHLPLAVCLLRALFALSVFADAVGPGELRRAGSRFDPRAERYADSSGRLRSRKTATLIRALPLLTRALLAGAEETTCSASDYGRIWDCLPDCG
jgi:geranylgeranyl diphosphate synthase type II